MRASHLGGVISSGGAPAEEVFVGRFDAHFSLFHTDMSAPALPNGPATIV
jgi:hypothetical protein